VLEIAISAEVDKLFFKKMEYKFSTELFNIIPPKLKWVEGDQDKKWTK
jgi:hypothetical protein